MVTEMTDKVILLLSNDIYNKHAVLDAKDKFSSYLQLSLSPKGNNFVLAQFIVKDKYKEYTRKIISECLNYILDKSIYIMLTKEAS